MARVLCFCKMRKKKSEWSEAKYREFITELNLQMNVPNYTRLASVYRSTARASGANDWWEPSTSTRHTDQPGLCARKDTSIVVLNYANWVWLGLWKRSNHLFSFLWALQLVPRSTQQRKQLRYEKTEGSLIRYARLRQNHCNMFVFGQTSLYYSCNAQCMQL